MEQGTFNLLSEILVANQQFIIPDLQRDYCWGTTIKSKKDGSLAHNFTRELLAEAKKDSVTGDFSYGLLYTYEYPRTFYYLCDGQQRLTTLYLLIGVVNTCLNDETLQRILVLPNGQPRLRYEVRNSTDDFIRNLVKEVFCKGEIEDLKNLADSNWFRSNYKDDPSVKSMIDAIESINQCLADVELLQIRNFLVRNAGFVFINLESNDSLSEATFYRIREFGEKMYELVNTCGDPMEPNEHLKAKLLAQIADSQRKEWTVKWELWQDFFWQYRGNYSSADEGFNEFLSWIGEIEDTEYSTEVIEQYFKAFYFLISVFDKLKVHRNFFLSDVKGDFLKGQKPRKVVLYPVLSYLKDNYWVVYTGDGYQLTEELVDLNSLFRFCRFFSNLSRNSEAEKEALNLAKYLRLGDDVALLADLQSGECVNLLDNDEEIFKLRLFSTSQPDERRIIEDAIWEAEDEKYLNGRIEPLLRSLGKNCSDQSVVFDVSVFVERHTIYKQIVEEEGLELVRLLLLANDEGFRSFYEGLSWGVHRYNLGTSDDLKFWRKWVRHDSFIAILRKAAGDYQGRLNALLYESASLVKNNEHRCVLEMLSADAMKHWQWVNTKRFFIYDEQLCFPNGVQAKGKTAKVKLMCRELEQVAT